jgi:pyruvate dehydrogenase E1 component
MRHTGQPDGHPGQDRQGLRPGRAGEGMNITHQQKKLNEDELKRVPRPASTSRSPTSRSPRRRSTSRRPGQPEMSTCTSAARPSAVRCRPAARPTATPCPCRSDALFTAVGGLQRRTRHLDHHGLVRCSPCCSATRQIGKPDRAHRPGRGAHLRHGGHVPPDRHLLPRRPALRAGGLRPPSCTTAKRRTVRSCRRASPRPGPCPRGSPPAPPTPPTASTMIPFYIYYSMFGFQRIGDLVWAAGDMRPGAS